MEKYIGILGVVVLLGIGYAFSSNRKHINPRTIFSALALQFAIALFVFKTPWGKVVLEKVHRWRSKLIFWRDMPP